MDSPSSRRRVSRALSTCVESLLVKIVEGQTVIDLGSESSKLVGLVRQTATSVKCWLQSIITNRSGHTRGVEVDSVIHLKFEVVSVMKRSCVRG